MGEIKNASESIVKGIKEVYDKLWEQREKLGSLMIAVGNLSNKAEKFEEENIQLSRALEEQKKEYERKLADAAKQK
ncbi:MAG: hypothetical protein WC726_02920 [Parcubacteria group bacterium]|jgi:regulator of replication initiation timing